MIWIKIPFVSDNPKSGAKGDGKCGASCEGCGAGGMEQKLAP